MVRIQVNNISHRLYIPFPSDKHIKNRIIRPSDNSRCCNRFLRNYKPVNTRRWVYSCYCRNKSTGWVHWHTRMYRFHRTAHRYPCRHELLRRHKRRRPFPTAVCRLYRRRRRVRRQRGCFRRQQQRYHIRGMIYIRCHLWGWFVLFDKFVQFRLPAKPISSHRAWYRWL